MKKYNSPPIPDQDDDPSVFVGGASRLELVLIAVAGVIVVALWFLL